MRYKNNGPVTLYVVVDVDYGDVEDTYTNKARAHGHARVAADETGRKFCVLTYDQRGTK